MERSIQVAGAKVSYSIRRSRRAKRARLCVYAGGAVVLTLPQRLGLAAAERFVYAKGKWILKTQERLVRVVKTTLPSVSAAAQSAHRAAAERLVKERLVHFNVHYGFVYQSVSIRSQKTRWGSCSDRGRLSFNYRLKFLPLHLVDYVVVHELCHLREPHHQPRFWALVAETVPDYRERRRALRGYALASGPG